MPAVPSATPVAAQLLGEEDRLGGLEPGNPLQDIELMTPVSFVTGVVSQP